MIYITLEALEQGLLIGEHVSCEGIGRRGGEDEVDVGRGECISVMCMWVI